jgi:NADH-quinone oxidoreductase subunit A
MVQSYFSIFFFFSLSILLSTIIFFLSYFVSSKSDDTEKLSAYECGFNPFVDSRNEFDIKFYLVAILFIIFDLEISFLFPFCSGCDLFDFSGFFSMTIFLFLLTIGFIYEWQKGALDWN